MHELLHERGQSRLVETLGDLGINDVFVLDAFRRVPRLCSNLSPSRNIPSVTLIQLGHS